jgi:TRAP-type C4-dicarboxylate transport system permease small subunit
MLKVIRAFDDTLEKISRWGLVFSLFVILGFAVLAIVLRWMGDSPMWIDPLVRHMVFLSAFLGGSLATSKGVHIRVDLFSKLLESFPSRTLRWLHTNVISLFCLVTTVTLMLAGWDFYTVEKEFGAPALLGLHSSWLVAIVPFGLGLIALRFLNQLLLGIMNGESLEHRRVH